jgi:hypothetical protein
LHWADFGLKGWETWETFMRCLHWLGKLPRDEHGRRLDLVLD